ncbi:MAG TPA: ABC transporter substrate-binding protein [Acetobacteraceae bacterium]|nr:ABC transporter substrate-binding protein [Acetobacteraceae bacterium]
MSFASMGRRRALQSAFAFTTIALRWHRSSADPGAVAPIRELCDSLLGVMRAGRSTPFPRRFDMLTPAIEHAFDLAAILQLSVGPSWTSLAAADQNTLLTAFRRYTIANYVNSFDNYNGQRFDIQPNTRPLPNGEQVAQTKIISSSGESHELDYVMRQQAAGWKAVDVLADGSISRVAVQRSDFRRLVSSGGARALIDSLNQKTSDLSGGALS